MLKDSITSTTAARIRSHKRAKSMLCDLSLLDVAEQPTGSSIIKSGHKRSKSQSISFSPQFLSSFAPRETACTTMPVSMAKNNSSVVITPPHSPVKRARVGSCDLSGSDKAVARNQSVALFSSPPPVLVSRPVVSLTTPRGGLPKHLLMPALEDLQDFDEDDEGLALFLPRQDSCSIPSLSAYDHDDTENDGEVAAITARIQSDRQAPRFALRPLKRLSVEELRI